MTMDVNIETEYEDGTPKITITSEKFAHAFEVVKSNSGFIFFEVSTTKGSVPKELQGQFTKTDGAVKAVLQYINKSKMSPTKQRDEKTKERLERGI